MSGARPAMLIAAVLGIAAGFVWLWWAEPAQWLPTEQGLVMTETLAASQFGVVATFSIIGAVVGVLIGLLLIVLVRPASWRLVPLALGGSFMAAFLCWVVGQLFGPSNPRDVSGVPVGELVPDQLVVDAWPALLVWPVGALLIVFIAVYWSEDNEQEVALQPEATPQSTPPTGPTGLE